MEERKFYAQSQERLDTFLSKQLSSSRSQVERLIKKGYVRVDKKEATKAGFKLKEGMRVEVFLPTMESSRPKEVDFAIERIYEDEDILVINKPAGLVVHPAPSVKEATLVDWLKQEGISLSTLSGEERHGIVHRLDKETSGLLVIAKNNKAHLHLSQQLQTKKMGRYYLAIITPLLKEDTIIEKPIARNPKNRLKMGVVEGGRYAKTFFKKLLPSIDEKEELIAAKLFTGRTHQIRVHLASINRHILGDSLYGFKSKKDTITRVFLHAYILYLTHPSSGERLEFVAPLPDDMSEYLQSRFHREFINETINPDNIVRSFDSF